MPRAQMFESRKPRCPMQPSRQCRFARKPGGHGLSFGGEVDENALRHLGGIRRAYLALRGGIHQVAVTAHDFRKRGISVPCGIFLEQLFVSNLIHPLTKLTPSACEIRQYSDKERAGVIRM